MLSPDGISQNGPPKQIVPPLCEGNLSPLFAHAPVA